MSHKMQQDEAARFHAAAKMIELDGPEGYFSCRERFGPEIAGMALVMWQRMKVPLRKEWPDDALVDRVNNLLIEAGRLEP